VAVSKLNLGLADLTVAMLDGRSIVTQQYSQAPLQLHRPLYVDGDDYPTVFLKTPSAGLLGGDKHQLRLYASRNATIKMLNQSATLVYPGPSEQDIEIYIEDGATVFFEPCPLILAAGASLVQTVRITMHPGSKLKYIDEWSAGRIAMNECFRFQRFDNTIEIWVGGALQYREHFVLEPLKNKPGSELICHHYTRFKSVYQIGPWEDGIGPSGQSHGSNDFLEPSGQMQSSKDFLEPAALSQPPASVFEGGRQIESAEEGCLAWRLKRPCGTIDRLLSMPSTTQTIAD